jgi:eukaryotic-like serine/threonine-protein kinase
MTTTDALLALLEESEVTADEGLGASLADLQALGAGPAPTPGPELAALLVADGPGRRRLHRRGAVIGALVILSLGTGVTAAAASPDVRDGAIGAVAAAVHVLQPPAAVQNRTPAPTADAPAARSSAARAAQPSASRLPAVPAVPAVHPSAPGDDGRGTRADDVAHHSTGPSEGRGHDASDSAGSRDGSSSGSGSGSGHGSSGGSSDSGSQSSGSGGSGDGTESGSHHGGGSGGDD